MKKFLLFLNGRYLSSDLKFYKSLLNNKTTIAVDGGYRFFGKINCSPDIILGDFDSIRKPPDSFDKRIKIVQFLKKKDKTDLHLALKYCLEQKCTSIEIVMPSVGEVDHFLGSIMLFYNNSILKKSESCRELKFITRNSFIHFVNNNKLIINKFKNRFVSVLPISNSILMSARGVEYECEKLRLPQGDSRALRNKITADRAVFDIKGQAFVIHRFK